MKLFFRHYKKLDRMCIRMSLAWSIGIIIACGTVFAYGAEDVLVQESEAHYVLGVKNASMAKFDDAASEFKKALEINDLNYDAREGLRIINSIDQGNISKDLALSIFASKKIGFQLERLEAKIQDISDRYDTLKRQVDIITADRTGKGRDIESKFGDLEFKVNRLQNDLDYIKRRNNY